MTSVLETTSLSNDKLVKQFMTPCGSVRCKTAWRDPSFSECSSSIGFMLNKRWLYKQHPQMVSTPEYLLCSLQLASPARVCFCQICKLHIYISQMSPARRFHLARSEPSPRTCSVVSTNSIQRRCDWSVYWTTNTRGGAQAVFGARDSVVAANVWAEPQQPFSSISSWRMWSHAES